MKNLEMIAAALIGAAAGLGGCAFRDPPLVTERIARDAGADAPAAIDATGEVVVTVGVRDATGTEHRLEEAPRRPQVRIEAAGAPFGDPEPAMLLGGAPDEDLRGDLGALPLRQSTRERIVGCEVTRDAGG